MTPQNQTKRALFLPILLLAFLIGGCTVHYVADYDASIKNETIRVAKEVDLFWGNLLDTPSNERQYDKFKVQYNEIETDIRGLLMQNEIRPLNEESTEQAQIALKLWIDDRTSHKKKDSISDFIAALHRSQYNRLFIAIAKGEEAKNMSASVDSTGGNK